MCISMCPCSPVFAASHCIICISPPVVSEPGFGRRIGRSEEGEKKMEAEISAALWRELLLS